jgi:hypothetical protein
MPTFAGRDMAIAAATSDRVVATLNKERLHWHDNNHLEWHLSPSARSVISPNDAVYNLETIETGSLSRMNLVYENARRSSTH